MKTNGIEDWFDDLINTITLRAEYYFSQSTDIELDREKFKHFIKQDLIRAISEYNNKRSI